MNLEKRINYQRVSFLPENNVFSVKTAQTAFLFFLVFVFMFACRITPYRDYQTKQRAICDPKTQTGDCRPFLFMQWKDHTGNANKMAEFLAELGNQIQHQGTFFLTPKKEQAAYILTGRFLSWQERVFGASSGYLRMEISFSFYDKKKKKFIIKHKRVAALQPYGRVDSPDAESGQRLIYDFISRRVLQFARRN